MFDITDGRYLLYQHIQVLHSTHQSNTEQYDKTECGSFFVWVTGVLYSTPTPNTSVKTNALKNNTLFNANSSYDKLYRSILLIHNGMASVKKKKKTYHAFDTHLG